MVCYCPMKAWRSKVDVGRITFNRKDGYVDRELVIPCGQCVGCRLERSRQWALRCVHEAQLHDDNCFLTLTYRDDDLPVNRSLDISHFQLFMKRYRFKYRDRLIRFFHCGEYGESSDRPHYHAIIFGHDFADKRLHRPASDGKQALYISKELESLWTKGFSTIGDVTFESAAYVARYVLKKVTGQFRDGHYLRFNKDTGEFYSLAPEYVTMSRRPGIASDWFKMFQDDVYPCDYVVSRGKKMRPPKFYDKLLKDGDVDLARQVKARRMAAGKVHSEDQSVDRLRVRETCQLERLSRLPRTLE